MSHIPQITTGQVLSIAETHGLGRQDAALALRLNARRFAIQRARYSSMSIEDKIAMIFEMLDEDAYTTITARRFPELPDHTFEG